MCYSFRTSIISYSLGMASAVFALATKQYILGCLILFYCQMQLSEALIWKAIDKNDISLNRAGTKYGQYLLPSHNIGIGLGIIIAAMMSGNKLTFYTILPLLIGIIFYAVIVLWPYRTEKYENVTFPADKCNSGDCGSFGNRLKWPYPHAWYAFSFLISLCFMLIYVKPDSSKIFIGSLFTISFLVAYLWYPKSVGSVWCFMAAVLSVILVVGNYLLIRGKEN